MRNTGLLLLLVAACSDLSFATGDRSLAVLGAPMPSAALGDLFSCPAGSTDCDGDGMRCVAHAIDCFFDPPATACPLGTIDCNGDGMMCVEDPADCGELVITPVTPEVPLPEMPWPEIIDILTCPSGSYDCFGDGLHCVAQPIHCWLPEPTIQCPISTVDCFGDGRTCVDDPALCAWLPGGP